MEMTGQVVAGSMEECMMLTLSSLPSRCSPSFVQLMEVRGRLKSEMETLKVKPYKANFR